jgi:hypothetical protein
MAEAFGTITSYHDIIYTRYNPQEFVGRKWLIEEVTRFRDDKDKRSLIIVGKPGSGKSTFLAYLAELWNCPRHFIRVDNIGGVTGVDPRAFLVSLGSQLYQKYGPDIFERGISGSTQVTVGWIKDQAQVVGRFVDELYTLPFLSVQRDDIQVKVGIATRQSQVIGERVKRLVDISLQLDVSTLLHAALINPLQKMQALYPTEKVVILIDALDESLYHSGMKIPDIIPHTSDADFPANLRLIMTTRPGEAADKFYVEDRLELNNVDKGYKEKNLVDIRTYIDRRLHTAPLAKIMHSWSQLDKKAYQHEVEIRSEGNFLYLYHFFNELVSAVEAGLMDLHSFKIPRGLDEIYRSFAVEKIRQDIPDIMRFTIVGKSAAYFYDQLRTIPGASQVEINDQDVVLTTMNSNQVIPLLFSSGIQIDNKTFQIQPGKQLGIWEEKYLPILGVLAVAYEPLYCEQISGFAGVEMSYVATVVAQIRQFLDVVVYEGDQAYRLYHLSFGEYLLDSQRNRDYPLNGPKYHYQIASYYRGGVTWDEVDWRAVKDSYPFNHLTAHLEASGYGKELHHLLASETNQQQNAWYEAKETRGDLAGYLADIRRAWVLAEHAYLPADITLTGANISLQCRYALIISSLNSLAENIPSRLLHFIVKRGVWTQHKGMLYARQVLDPLKRAEAIAALLPFVDKTEQMEWFREGLRALQAVSVNDSDEYDYVQALLGLLSHYSDPKPEDMLRAILALIPSLKKYQDEVFVALEPYLSEVLLLEALNVARGIRANTQEITATSHGLREASDAAHWNRGSLRALATLAHRLPSLLRQEVFEEILVTSRETHDPVYQSHAFLALVRYERSPTIDVLMQDIVITARAFLFQEGSRVLALYILMDMLPYLLEDEQEQTLQELLDVIQKLSFNTEDILVRLASQLPLSLRGKVLSEAQRISYHEWRKRTLAKLVPYFAGEQREALLREVLLAAHTSSDGIWPAEDIGKLSCYMSPELLQEALDVTRHHLEEHWKVRALAGLAEQFSGSEREEVLQEALDAVKALNEQYRRYEAIDLLAPLLSVSLLKEALAIVQTIDEGTALLSELPYLLTSVPDSVRELMGRFSIEVLPKLRPEWAQVGWIEHLAPYWPETLAIEAFRLARGFKDPFSKVKALAALARSGMVQEAEREKVVKETLTEVEKFKSILDKAHSLAKLATVPCLSLNETIVQQALDAWDELDNKALQAPILMQLAPVLTPSRREQVMLAMLEKPTSSWKSRGILQSLAPQFSEQIVWSLLYLLEPMFFFDARWSLPHLRLRLVLESDGEDEIISALLARLAELGDPISAYRIAMATEMEITKKVKMLGGLAPYLPAAQCLEALHAVLHIPTSPNYEPTLAKLYIRIAEFDGGEKVLNHIQEMKDLRWQAQALTGIAPYVKREMRNQILQEALAATLSIRHGSDRHNLLAVLSLQFAIWPSSSLYELWRPMLAQLAQRRRVDLVSDLYCLNPMLTALRGKEFPVELLQTIRYILRWWT